MRGYDFLKDFINVSLADPEPSPLFISYTGSQENVLLLELPFKPRKVQFPYLQFLNYLILNHLVLYHLTHFVYFS